MKNLKPSYNKSELAEIFGLSRTTIQKKIDQAGLEGDDRGRGRIYYRIDLVTPLLTKVPAKHPASPRIVSAASPKLFRQMQRRIDALERQVAMLKDESLI